MVKVSFKSLFFVCFVSSWCNIYAADVQHFQNAYDLLKVSDFDSRNPSFISEIEYLKSSLGSNNDFSLYEKEAEKYVRLQLNKVKFNSAILALSLISFASIIFTKFFEFKSFILYQQHTVLMPLNGALLGFWIQNSGRDVVFVAFCSSLLASLIFKPEGFFSFINSLAAGLMIPTVKALLDSSSLPYLYSYLEYSAMNKDYKIKELIKIISLIAKKEKWNVKNFNSFKLELDNFFSTNDFSKTCFINLGW